MSDALPLCGGITESAKMDFELDEHSVQFNLGERTVTLYFPKENQENAMESIEEILMDSFEERKGIRRQKV